jgi:hypothetical protein
MKTHLLKQLRRQYGADCNMMYRSLLIAFIILICSFVADAQTQGDSITLRVQVIDSGNLEAIPFANIVAYQNGVQTGVATSNFDGFGSLKLKKGAYDVKAVYIGYEINQRKNISIVNIKDSVLIIRLKGSGEICCIEYVTCCCCGGCFDHYDEYAGIDWWHAMWTPYRNWYDQWKEKKTAKHKRPQEVLPCVSPMIKEDTTEETIVSADTLINSRIVAVGSLSDDVKIYPNPCSDVLHISLVDKIQMLNAEGKVIREESINGTELEIKVNDLANGIYYLNYEKEGKRGTKKVVVQ